MAGSGVGRRRDSRESAEEKQADCPGDEDGADSEGEVVGPG